MEIYILKIFYFFNYVFKGKSSVICLFLNTFRVYFIVFQVFLVRKQYYLGQLRLYIYCFVFNVVFVFFVIVGVFYEGCLYVGFLFGVLMEFLEVVLDYYVVFSKGNLFFS